LTQRALTSSGVIFVMSTPLPSKIIMGYGAKD
jgi:hypothetical protein